MTGSLLGNKTDITFPSIHPAPYVNLASIDSQYCSSSRDSEEATRSRQSSRGRHSIHIYKGPGGPSDWGFESFEQYGCRRTNAGETFENFLTNILLLVSHYDSGFETSLVVHLDHVQRYGGSETFDPFPRLAYLVTFCMNDVLQGFKVVIRDIGLHMSNRLMDYISEDSGLCPGALDNGRGKGRVHLTRNKKELSSVQEYLERSYFVQVKLRTTVLPSAVL